MCYTLNNRPVKDSISDQLSVNSPCNTAHAGILPYAVQSVNPARRVLPSRKLDVGALSLFDLAREGLWGVSDEREAVEDRTKSIRKSLL